MTIPAIKDFIDGHGLKFIGFDLDDAAAQNFRALFAANGWSMTDLDKWHAIESRIPQYLLRHVSILGAEELRTCVLPPHKI